MQVRPVVVIDDAGCHAAAIHCRDHAFVVEYLEALQPLQRLLLSLEREHSAHERQKVRIAWRDTDLALPFRPGEIEQRRR